MRNMRFVYICGIEMKIRTSAVLQISRHLHPYICQVKQDLMLIEFPWIRPQLLVCVFRSVRPGLCQSASHEIQQSHHSSGIFSSQQLGLKLFMCYGFFWMEKRLLIYLIFAFLGLLSVTRFHVTIGSWTKKETEWGSKCLGVYKAGTCPPILRTLRYHQLLIA